MRNNSNAIITEHMCRSNSENITDWFEDDDVHVVDRGFRDTIDILKGFGIYCKAIYPEQILGAAYV